MMRSVTTRETPKEQTDYPCLKEMILVKDSSSSLVVLFFAHKDGTVVSESKYYKLGYHSACWDESGFRPLSGSVTLSND